MANIVDRVLQLIRKDDPDTDTTDTIANGTTADSEISRYNPAVQHDQSTLAYLAAREEWDERFINHVENAAQWRRLTFYVSIVALLSLIACIYLATRLTIVPIVVTVDSETGAIGETYNIPTMVDQEVSEIVYRWILTEWIENLRTISVDANNQSDKIRELFAYIRGGDPTASIVSEILEDMDPYETAKNHIVHVQVIEVRNLSRNNWYIIWRERTIPRDGTRSSIREYTATLTTVQDAIDETVVDKNPLGVYVIEMDWSGEGKPYYE